MIALFMEIAANFFNAVSILLAGRNSVHTWWTGIIGCLLFGWVFFQSQLYADTTLQLFFIASSVAGWWHWQGRKNIPPLPIRRTLPGTLGLLLLIGSAVAMAYGWLLHRFTNAYAPFLDSLVLAFSVIAQFLLMGRRLETWWGWLLVNTIAVPLYFSRGLYLTAALYAVFWINALFSLRHWRRQLSTR